MILLKNANSARDGESVVNRAFASPPELPPTGLDRRAAIKSLGFAAAALMLPAGLSNHTTLTGTLLHGAKGRSSSPSPVKNPAWYGFNLLEYFSTDADWMKYFPYKNDGMFQEDDFRWIRDWGLQLGSIADGLSLLD